MKIVEMICETRRGTETTTEREFMTLGAARDMQRTLLDLRAHYEADVNDYKLFPTLFNHVNGNLETYTFAVHTLHDVL